LALRATAQRARHAIVTTLYDFTVNDIQGKPVSLAAFRDQVVVVVNTASKCVFTPQYTELQALYDGYRDRGLTILGFPCNQFGEQEPGTNDQVKTFCETTYSVTFPLFQKVDVNGDAAAPLFEYLKTAAPGLLGSKKIKWNFTKFLIGKDGTHIERFAPNTKPSALKSSIEKLLR
jgi:glutathione peroxidase